MCADAVRTDEVGPGSPEQAARCSDYTAYMYLGELVEFGETDQLFLNPARKETQDYITGRFG